MRWFKLDNAFAWNSDIQSLSEVMQRRWLMFLCFQSEKRIETVTVTLRAVTLASFLRISADDLAATKAEFLARGLINDDFTILHWARHAPASQDSSQRVRAFRARAKEESAKRQKVKRDVTVTVTDQKRLRNKSDDSPSAAIRNKGRKEGSSNTNNHPSLLPSWKRDVTVTETDWSETHAVVKHHFPGTQFQITASEIIAHVPESVTDHELAVELSRQYFPKQIAPHGWTQRIRNHFASHVPPSDSFPRLDPPTRDDTWRRNVAALLASCPNHQQADDWRAQLSEASESAPPRKPPQGVQLDLINDKEASA